MTPSGRVARRSHGIQQHGGGGAVGRLVPLPAGKRTCGVGWGGGGGPRELQACDLQGLLVRGPLAPSALPWARREPWGWGVGAAEAGPGVPERSSRAGAERAGGEGGGRARGRGRASSPSLPHQLHVHRGLNGGLGAQRRHSEKAAKHRDGHGSRVYTPGSLPRTFPASLLLTLRAHVRGQFPRWLTACVHRGAGVPVCVAHSEQ